MINCTRQLRRSPGMKNEDLNIERLSVLSFGGCCFFFQAQERKVKLEEKRRKLAAAAALLEGRNADGLVSDLAPAATFLFLCAAPTSSASALFSPTLIFFFHSWIASCRELFIIIIIIDPRQNTAEI